jgi:hypothetical protein
MLRTDIVVYVTENCSRSCRVRLRCTNAISLKDIGSIVLVLPQSHFNKTLMKEYLMKSLKRTFNKTLSK